MRYLILVILTFCASAVAADQITVTQRGGQRGWNAYLGPERISEARLFSLAGDQGLAVAADQHSTGRASARFVGPAMILAGAALAILPRQENDNANATMPFMLMGAGAGLFGVERLWSGLLAPKRAATYEQAQAAAETYNAVHK